MVLAAILAATDARHGRPSRRVVLLLLMLHGPARLIMPRGRQPGPARDIMPLLPALPTHRLSHGMDMPVRSHATMRLRRVSAIATSLAMRTTGRGHPFRDGASVRSVRGNGSRLHG